MQGPPSASPFVPPPSTACALAASGREFLLLLLFFTSSGADLERGFEEHHAGSGCSRLRLAAKPAAN